MNTLETERLLIRPLTVEDLNDIHRLLDVDLQWAGPNVSLEQRQHRLLFQIGLAHWQDTGCLYGDRGIVLRESGRLIGICGFRPWICSAAERGLFEPTRIEDDLRLATLELGVGYALSSQYRRQGYAAEAVWALIEHAFRALRVRRIVALAERGNLDSVDLMRRVGMKVAFNANPEVAYPWAVGVIENNSQTADG